MAAEEMLCLESTSSAQGWAVGSVLPLQCAGSEHSWTGACSCCTKQPRGAWQLQSLLLLLPFISSMPWEIRDCPPDLGAGKAQCGDGCPELGVELGTRARMTKLPAGCWVLLYPEHPGENPTLVFIIIICSKQVQG